jgi:hypothetical protein
MRRRSKLKYFFVIFSNEEPNHLVDLGINGWMALKWTLKRMEEEAESVSLWIRDMSRTVVNVVMNLQVA